MGLVAQTIIPGAKLTRGYAEGMLKDVKPEQFARLARGVHSNHPAWVFGHLSIYPDRIAEMIGRMDLARPDDRFTKLFANKTESVDDPTGAIYPPMKEIVDRYFTLTDAVIAAVAETSDDVFARVITGDSMADRLPTVGSRANFLLGAHCMSHFGQVSAWRRFMGLGPVF